MKDGDISLILKNVNTKDAGTYEGHASVKSTPRRKRAQSELRCIINLKVVDLVPEEMTAPPGVAVTLPCRAPKHIIPAAVGWRRRDLQKYIYFQKTERAIEPREQEPAFLKRVKLKDTEMKDGDLSLILMNVSVSDAGTYECYCKHSVMAQGKRTAIKNELISIISLKVKGNNQRYLYVGVTVAVLAILAGIVSFVKYIKSVLLR
ncbi:uncharacterized protein LOC113168678 [Anabas testudineus]|uniref:uncharacterized protein LOC113168678 n=1 Tax=Anabas testudineus TaxID=64144 RepID=UPI00143DB86E|nr:uncharacterized protein LOC113168678 [Anabas testudineus]